MHYVQFAHFDERSQEMNRFLYLLTRSLPLAEIIRRTLSCSTAEQYLGSSSAAILRVSKRRTSETARWMFCKMLSALQGVDVPHRMV